MGPWTSSLRNGLLAVTQPNFDPAGQVSESACACEHSVYAVLFVLSSIGSVTLLPISSASPGACVILKTNGGNLLKAVEPPSPIVIVALGANGTDPQPV